MRVKKCLECGLEMVGVVGQRKRHLMCAEKAKKRKQKKYDKVYYKRLYGKSKARIGTDEVPMFTFKEMASPYFIDRLMAEI